MAKYYYFTSFTFFKANQNGIGNSGYCSSEEITSMEQIMNMEDEIASNRNFDSCLVTNFQLLRKED